MENNIDRQMLIAFTAIIWKYGEIFVDDNEIEFHIAKISYDDFMDFSTQLLEVYHDEKDRISYYRVRKAN